MQSTPTLTDNPCIGATRKELVLKPEDNTIVVSLGCSASDNIETGHEFYKRQCEQHLRNYTKAYALLKHKMSDLAEHRTYKRARVLEVECVICNSAIEYEHCTTHNSRGVPVALPCGHNYHETCIRQWAAKSVKPTQTNKLPCCPLCKQCFVSPECRLSNG